VIPEEELRAAAARSCEIYVNCLAQGYDPENQHMYSPEFEKKIKKLKRKADHPVFYHAMRLVASIVLAVLITAGAWIAVDAEARATLVGWVKEVYGTFFAYRYSDEITGEVETKKYRPEWIPDGYTEVYSDDTSDGGSVLYESEEGNYLQFFYIVRPNESNLFVENTDAVKYPITINGQLGDYIKSENSELSDSIIWTDESDHLFYVSGFLAEDELVKFAESVK
jgi:hypothetical protein